VIAPPILNAALALGTNVILSWPALVPYAGFTLQQSGDLSAPTWTSVTNHVDTVGGTNQVTLQVTGSSFFRLIGP
jgi:hypothetical protein